MFNNLYYIYVLSRPENVKSFERTMDVRFSHLPTLSRKCWRSRYPLSGSFSDLTASPSVTIVNPSSSSGPARKDAER